MKQNQTISNLKKCPRWNYCSTNICPLDPDVNLRNKLPKENICPFCLKKKAGFQKGIRTLSTDSVLEVVPESNIKLLNRRNQKRWHEIKNNQTSENYGEKIRT